MHQGISEEEFTQLQNQFLALKATNYALEEDKRKQASVLAEHQSRLQRSDREVARLQQVVDKSKKAREVELILQTNASLEKKLVSQEDDFRLQNQTLLQELSVYVSANEKLENELQALQDGKPELLESRYAEEMLHLRAESEALRQELAAVRDQTATELAQLRHKVAALTEVNAQLERAARPDDADPVLTEDSEYVEVGSAEVCYKKAASSAHELLEVAEQRIQELQEDIQQYADMRLALDTTRRELDMARDEARRLRDGGAAAGRDPEAEQLPAKLARKQESYLRLQEEMEALRQSKQAEIDDLRLQQQRDAAEARERTQRYQTQLNNGYSVLKAEREKSAATIKDLTDRLRKHEPVEPAGEQQQQESEVGAGDSDQSAPSAELASLAETTERLRHTEAEAEAQREEGEARIADAEARLLETETRLAESEARLVATEARLAETETDRDDASKLAAKRKSVLDEMAAHINQLTEEHAEVLKTAGEARDRLQTLVDQRTDELQGAGQCLAQTEADLGRAQESLESERRLRLDQERRLAEREREHAARLQRQEQEAAEERQERTRMEEAHSERVKDLTMQLEITSAQLAEFKEKAAALRQEVKDSVDEKRIHERKGASVIKDLRRQLAQERRRADKLQQALQDAPLADKPAELSPPPPPESDVQSVSSWSLMSGENGAPSANGSGDSPVDTETVGLLARITRLQEEKWRVEEKLNHLEQSSGALADDLASKAALIQFYCMEGRQAAAAHASSEGLAPVKKLVDFVKHLSQDEQQREMQRRMQNMLEETLTKNMHLQQNLKTMSDELVAARRKAAGC
ncbi:GRIP1-associated protein 1-like [Pollicipes pollicipes]|uniref:GRIP1-associated protein 1-like n=1 Tax=Pollicipes pollicipes TaxID=41117 RepID=UPI0018849984|nr:GRIP1-associated protein 1-like [Pollicipes pollicipes]